MRTRLITLISYAVNLILFSVPTYATISPIVNLETTPEIKTNTFEEKILLEKVSFKDENNDFIQFKVQSNKEKVNLKGISFFDDKDFKTISTDFFANTNKEITLTFNSTEKDNESNNNLFTTKKGLTATTEQILIHFQKQPLAFFCWSKTPPSKTEATSFPKIVPIEIWDESDIESCFPSEQVKKNQIIEKVFEENNSAAWEIQHTKEKQTEENNEKEDLVKLIELQSSSIDNDSPIQITEIYPYPNKDEQEWIEIFNSSSLPINLHNWIIDDEEGGSKPKRIPNLYIDSHEAKTINLKELKINLNNDDDSIRLFTQDGVETSEQEYSSAKKGKAYALIEIDGETHWEWTDSPTPNKENPVLTSLEITIENQPQFNNSYFFSALDHENKKILITFTEEIIKAPLAKEVFKPGTKAKIIGEINEAPTNENNYQSIINLYSYEIIPSSGSEHSWTWTFIILTGLIIGAFLFIQKYLPNKKDSAEALSM